MLPNVLLGTSKPFFCCAVTCHSGAKHDLVHVVATCSIELRECTIQAYASATVPKAQVGTPPRMYMQPPYLGAFFCAYETTFSNAAGLLPKGLRLDHAGAVEGSRRWWIARLGAIIAATPSASKTINSGLDQGP